MELKKIHRDYYKFIDKWPRDHHTGNHWYWKRVRMTYFYKVLDDAGFL